MRNSIKISLCALALTVSLAGSPMESLRTAWADCPVGDLNRDCKVNLEDLLVFAGQWLDGPGCVGHPDDCADLIGGDGVDMADFGIMSQDWQQQGTGIPPAPSLIFPAYESNVAGTNIDFSWSTSAGATNYHLQVADDSGFSSLIYDGDVGDNTTINVGAFPSDGSRFYWHVKAGNYVGDPVTEDLISAASTQWHYRKGQSEPPSDWRELSFTEDGTWQVGQAPIGYSNRGEFTPNTELSDMEDNYWTVYARHSFEIDTPVGYELDTLTLRLFIDDGCIVSINDDELHRFNVSDGPKNYNDGSGLSYLNASWIQTELFDVSSLQEGTNILAMHVLNQALSSSDIAVEAELIANFVPLGLGGWSEYSDTWYFDNGTAPPPSVPGLSLPADESKVGGTSIDFSWSDLPLADNYYLQVATDSGFGSLIYDGAVGDVTSISIGSFPDDGTRYYWHVRAGNASGWSGYSTDWYFDNEDPPPPPDPSLKINEFVASNLSTVSHPGNRLDEFGDDVDEFEDWIEIYNAGDEAVDIGGMYLTDKLSNPMKWQIPDDSPGETTIGSHGYLLIWADGEPDEGVLHVDFQLGKNGGEIGLFESDGSTLIDSVIYGQQVTDASYGRYPNAGGDWRYYGSPTPGAQNTGMGYLGLVADPEFSVQRGFHEEAFDVTLTCSTPGAAIYYTIGSSDPTESSDMYTSPVAITGTTCLRAKAFRTDYLPSASVTHTYIYVDEIIDHPNMWTNISQDPVWGPQMEGALLEIPTISLVTPHAILEEPLESPPEVPVSIEMIFPDGAEGFQANAGVERFGRQYTIWPKQALRVSFKKIYGPSRLKFDLFGDTPYGGNDTTKSFNQIILRNGSHDSLFCGSYDSKGVYTRGRYCYDRQIEMGHLSCRGKFVHMYQNGEYRGQYHLFERPTADFMSQYLGGEEEDYDIVKGRGGLQYMEGDFRADGKIQAWLDMKANLGNWEFVKENIDIDNLIDYLILNFYGGNDHDWYGDHNWVAGRKREPGGKWMFYMWDNDFLFRRLNANTLDNGTPSGLYGSLKQHEEFRVRMGDRAQKHFFNDGMLTPARVQADFTELRDRTERTTIPEYARWSLEGSGGSFDPDTLYQSVDWIKFTWGNVRTDTTVQQMRNDGVFPNVVAPSFNQHGGSVPSGFNLAITAPAGTIYYTLDGSDPRQIGGAVAPSAMLYSGGPITLTNSVIAKARAKSGSTWSALNEATFGIGPIADDLRITEVMYHPTDPTQAEKAAINPDPIDEDFEYIEVKNIGGAPINLNLVHFTDGIDFTFGDYWLGDGDFAVIVKNQDAFEARYPGVSTSLIAGTYTGALDNGGEEIVMRDALGAEIHDFDYRDSWFVVTDGGGYSLNKLDPDTASNAAPDSWDSQPGWRPSSVLNGTPGADDTYIIEAEGIVISEVMTHTDDLVYGDWIEIWNRSASTVYIDGWFLSDNENNLMKYEIAAGDPRATIAPDDYVVFDSVNDFRNPGDPGSHVQFGLSEYGEDVYLTSGAGGVLTGEYSTEQENFGAAENGVTLGMYIKSDASDDFVRLQTVTKGSANNNDPVIGPAVISELMYNPQDPDSTAEFIEVTNITGSTVYLYDPANPANTWQIKGVSYAFPPGVTLSGNETILITRGDPVQFRSTYGIGAGIDIYGPYPGALDNAGEKVTLIQPGTPDPVTSEVPEIRIDRVNYSDGSHPTPEEPIDPWPVSADGDSLGGLGHSLHRKVLADYGNDIDNWQAASPTPGY